MKKFLVETHCHTEGISACATITAGELAAKYRSKGYDALVVTNHYGGSMRFGSRSNYIDRFEEESRHVEAECRKQGIKVYGGAEVTLDRYGWEDYLLIGEVEKFLRANPSCVDFTRKELFEAACAHGVAVFNAHPYRPGAGQGEARYMHGIEVYNAQTDSPQNTVRAKGFAAANNLRMIAGSDLHHGNQRAMGGIYLDALPATSAELAKSILDAQPDIYINGSYIKIS